MGTAGTKGRVHTEGPQGSHWSGGEAPALSGGALDREGRPGLNSGQQSTLSLFLRLSFSAFKMKKARKYSRTQVNDDNNKNSNNKAIKGKVWVTLW